MSRILGISFTIGPTCVYTLYTRPTARLYACCWCCCMQPLYCLNLSSCWRVSLWNALSTTVWQVCSLQVVRDASSLFDLNAHWPTWPMLTEVLHAEADLSRSSLRRVVVVVLSIASTNVQCWWKALREVMASGIYRWWTMIEQCQKD